MHKQISTYLNEVCSQVRFSEAHPQIRLELYNHMEEIIAEQKNHGLSEEEAVHHAISQMGSADTVGKQLDKAHRPRIEWSLILLTLAFMGLGLVTLFFMQKTGFAGDRNLFSHSLPFTLCGMIIALLIMLFVKYEKLRHWSGRIYWGTVILSVLILFTGRQVNGMPFLHLGSVSINIIALTPSFFVIALAGIFADIQWETVRSRIKALLFFLIPVLLYAMTPSLSSIIMYSIVFIILMQVAGAGWKNTLLLAALMVGLVVMIVLSHPYSLHRFLVFLFPYTDPSGGGWQQILARETIQAAGLWGQGFTLPLHSLPAGEAQYIFTYIVYSLGWVMGIIIASLLCLYIIRLLFAARVIKDRYGFLLITGIALVLGVETLFNLLLALGLGPLAAISLPFVSYGSTQMMLQTFCLGLVLSVYRCKDLDKDLPHLEESIS